MEVIFEKNQIPAIFVFKIKKMSDASTAPLTNLQIELLKTYALHLSDEDLLEIRRMLKKYFYQKMVESADRDWVERGYTQELMNEIKQGSTA